MTGRVRGRSSSGYRVTLVLAILGLNFGAGCAGPTTPPSWREDGLTIEPDLRRLSSGPPATGDLVVETATTGIQQGPIQQRYKFFLYDAEGAFLSESPNDRPAPLGLFPGKYIVETRVGFVNKRVQVIIRKGLTTSVGLKDFEMAGTSN